MQRMLAGAIAIVALALAGVGCGEDSGSEPEAPPTEAQPAPEPEPPQPQPPDEGEDGGERPDEDPVDEPPPIDEDELTEAEREAVRTVRAYIEGLDERDGEAVCDLLAPGAIDAVELPRRRGGCARSLAASIGYRDPRGLPVWAGARVQGLLTVALDDESASITATTVTRFADRDEPSIEDDVVHLVRSGDRWLVAKPSSTLYRAVGIADVPPRVLAPP